LAES